MVLSACAQRSTWKWALNECWSVTPSWATALGCTALSNPPFPKPASFLP